MPRRLINVVARTRVQVDAARWIEEFGSAEGEIRDEVRDYVVGRLVLGSQAAKAKAITDARRDQL